MGFRYEFECLGCGSLYEGNIGGGIRFELFRCESCDNTKILQKTIPMFHPGKCICGGEYKTWIEPKCPRCKGKGKKKKIVYTYG